MAVILPAIGAEIAVGTGALAFAAARTGAQVLATDFSPGMVARIARAGLPNVAVKVMDGQSLDVPDASFDAVFSIFGVFMFPDWRKGLSEMARVTRPGGKGVVATWQKRGAGSFMLLGDVLQKLFPDREIAAMPEAITLLSDPGNFARELVNAGFRDPQVEYVTYDFDLNLDALADPDKLFGPSPDWNNLNSAQKTAVIAEIQQTADNKPILPIPSTALIAVASR